MIRILSKLPREMILALAAAGAIGSAALGGGNGTIATVAMATTAVVSLGLGLINIGLGKKEPPQGGFSDATIANVAALCSVAAAALTIELQEDMSGDKMVGKPKAYLLRSLAFEGARQIGSALISGPEVSRSRRLGSNN